MGSFSYNRLVFSVKRTRIFSRWKKILIKSFIFSIISSFLSCFLSSQPVLLTFFLVVAFTSFDKWTPQSDTDVSVQWDRQFIMHTHMHTPQNTHIQVLLATDHFRPVTQVWFDWEVWLEKSLVGPLEMTEAQRESWGSGEGGWRAEREIDEKTERVGGREEKTLCCPVQSSEFLHRFLLKLIHDTIILHH